MTVEPGTYEIGPANGRLVLRTYRQGMAAKAGHDLVLEARSWQGEVTVPTDQSAEPSVTAQVDLRELHVVQGTGGVKPLSEGDKEEIRRAMTKPLQTDRHPTAQFASSHVETEGDHAALDGTLLLAGANAPVRLEVEQSADGKLRATTTITQSRWGIKPYSGFFGALKLKDDVELELELSLGGS